MYVNGVYIPDPMIVRVLPPVSQNANFNKGTGKYLRPYQLCLDAYGNRIFWGTLKILLRRGYYNNIAQKKAAMEGTYSNYGWQYSAEQYVLGRSRDPKRYKDCVPANPKGKPWPEHIMVIAKDKKSDQKVQHKR